jgi:hypothetical protein
VEPVVGEAAIFPYYGNKRSAREADKLPLGQIEHDLCFDFC